MLSRNNAYPEIFLLGCLTILFRRHAFVLFEYAEKVFAVVVSDCLGDLVELAVSRSEQVLGFFNAYGIDTVSYTHLDVYKRQGGDYTGVQETLDNMLKEVTIQDLLDMEYPCSL